MASPSPLRPPLTRGGARPVRRRTRTFRPNYLSFAGTYQCNLTCPHCCVPIEWTDRLDIGVAIRFLEDAHAYGIEVLGLTGGEPFLYPEFVHALCRRANVAQSGHSRRCARRAPFADRGRRPSSCFETASSASEHDNVDSSCSRSARRARKISVSTALVDSSRVSAISA